MISKPYAQNHQEFLLAVPEICKKNILILHTTIKEVVPEAKEIISYGLPTFDYLGGLCAIGYTKNHVAFYAMSNTVFREFKSVMHGLDYALATIRFKFEEEIPVELIKKIVMARAMENENNFSKKKKK